MISQDTNSHLSRKNNSYSSRRLKTINHSKRVWWTPVWNGLLLEEGARHYRAMGRAVWLYLYLLIYANRATGKLFRRLPTIANDTGIGIRTIRRWVKQLKEHNYIETRQTGRSLEISVTKWKPIKKR